MRFVIYAFVFIGIIHTGNILYGPAVKNHMLEGKMIQLSEERRLKADQYLMRDLKRFIDENNIDIDPAVIQLYRPTPQSVVISAEYKIYAEMWFLNRDYHFKISSNNRSHGLMPNFSTR